MQQKQLQVVDNCQTCKLRRQGFFCDLSPATLADFEAIKVTIPYYPGALLFAEGDQARGVYVLCQGRVKLTVGSGDRMLVISICHPGQILGLPSCVAGRPYQFSAEVMEPCQVNFARREDFLKYLNSHPDVAFRAAQRVSENLQDVMSLVHTMGLAQSATERMARFFLMLASDLEALDPETRLGLEVTQRELAQTIGATRETACRVLGNFKKMNAVTIEGSKLFIQNKAALRAMARIS